MKALIGTIESHILQEIRFRARIPVKQGTFLFGASRLPPASDTSTLQVLTHSLPYRRRRGRLWGPGRGRRTSLRLSRLQAGARC